MPAVLASKTSTPAQGWHDVFDADGEPRPQYATLLNHLRELRPKELRNLDERMQATLREMGVTFDFIREMPWGQQPWICDLLPQIFTVAEWETITRGIAQRLRAFEMFLQDAYGSKSILRAGVLPIQPVMGSPLYQLPAVGLPCVQEAFLHLSGIALVRLDDGSFAVKHHQFGHASGISYMMQNRRALARVLPDLFRDVSVQSLVNAPLAITAQLRGASAASAHEAGIVLLTPGAGSALYSQHSLLARRMGVPLVQGGDLLVLDDRVYLKTVKGLARVEVIYNRVPDDMLDPLVFNRSSRLGIPGLTHCIRKGSVKLVNGIGSQLADDRSLQSMAGRIVRYYLGEEAILPSLETLWLGDLDAREMVLDDPARYDIRRSHEDDLGASPDTTLSRRELLQQVENDPGSFVAQPREAGARTICFEKSRTIEGRADYLIFALRAGDRYEVLPSALTRVFVRESTRSAKLGWISKDTWVPETAAPADPPRLPARRSLAERPPTLEVTSRVAEAFYWMGRYLERAFQQAYLIQVIESLETEELNSAERRHYRPIWSQLLPPLDKKVAGSSRRSISNPTDRYHLMLFPGPGSVAAMVGRVIGNAESVQECLSPEAWATLSHLLAGFQKTRFRKNAAPSDIVRMTRRMSELATTLIPQFFAVSAMTMIADDAWRFCVIGQMLERAIVTGNAVLSIDRILPARFDVNSIEAHHLEIELSAFLRLLGTRDAYRRVYQMRAEPVPVMELLWQHPEVPRSVLRCLARCVELLSKSASSRSLGAGQALEALEALCDRIRQIDWNDYIEYIDTDPDAPGAGAVSHSRRQPKRELTVFLGDLLSRTHSIHGLISDGFLNHQAHIAQSLAPKAKGPRAA